MTKPESSRFLNFVKRVIDFIDGPLEVPRCRAPFCGDPLSEADIQTGRILCQTCEPAINRMKQLLDWSDLDDGPPINRKSPRPFGNATGKVN
jgi:hypothetical protein